MKEADIRQYAGLMQELGLTALEITEDNKKVRLERMVPAPASASMSSMIPVGQEAEKIMSESIPGKTDGSYQSVRSPLVGIFYAAPAENADPYVSIGDFVKKGQVLCLVEAMKLMNEIVAEEDGIISKICVTNGQVVEYGTELFQIKQAV